MAGGETGNQMGNQAKAIAGGAGKVAKTTKKVAKGAAKAAKKATSRLSPIVKIKIFCVAFALMLLISIISMMASIISNAILHTNDPEQIAGEEDIFEYEDSERNKEELNAKAEEADELFGAALDAAYASCYEDLLRFCANKYKFSSVVTMDEDQTKETLVMLYCAYSASMKNAVSQESNDYYMNNEIDAMEDLSLKVNKLARAPHPTMPFGNVIYGGDFFRDENGEIIVTPETECVTPEVRDPETGEVITEAVYETFYYVTPVISRADIESICQDAFGFKLTDPYDAEELSSQTYGDVIIDMCGTMAETLYGEEWAKDRDFIWATQVGSSNSSITAFALSQVGNGGLPYCQAYGYSYQVPWCAIFVWYCAKQSGYVDVFPKTASCGTLQDYFKSEGRYTSANTGYIPQPGDIIFFDWGTNGYGHRDHVGIVTGCNGTQVFTVEGNSGSPGRVREKTYSISYADILGYAHPNYTIKANTGTI